MENIENLVNIAHDLADRAAQLSKQYFRQQRQTMLKQDHSPVTDADLAIEYSLKEHLRRVLPHHSTWGEEYGLQQANSEYIWLIDPIDGTTSFACGKPSFCTLIALVKNDLPVIGIIDQPIMQERWCGIWQQSSTYNHAPCCTQMQSAMLRLSCTTPLMFNIEQWEKFLLLKAHASVISFGGDGYAYGLLASGFIDIIFEANLKPYDVAALIPIIQGAGGVITDWQGNDIVVNQFNGTVLATANPQLQEKFLKLIN